MHDGKLSGPSLVGRLGRALVVLSSAGLAAVVVLRAGGVAGCDGPAAAPPEQVAPVAAEPVKAEPVKAEPVKAEAHNAAPETAAPATGAPGTIDDRRGQGGDADSAGPPAFIGGSKSGVFIEHVKPPSLKREAAAKEPAQQPPQPPPPQQQQAVPH